MHFSCKITNAILTTLEFRGEDLSSLYEPGLPPMELLRDPSSWMSAPDMENFLEALLRRPWSRLEEPLLTAAGHGGPKNHAWGVLDSVLRMMPRPQEIFQQPERFLSYFISPEPPIENLQRDERGLAFDLPLPAEQYPLVTAYLKAAFESLPLYVGQDLAHCEWSDIHLKITWPESQKSIFQEDPGHQISPELLQAVVEDHQRLQRELEEKNLELQRKDEEIRHIRSGQTETPAKIEVWDQGRLSKLGFEEASPAHVVGQNLARLHDYMVRAQQLITILTVAGKKDPSVKEALRRLDWDHVKSQYPRAIAESAMALRKIQHDPSSARPAPLEEDQAHV